MQGASIFHLARGLHRRKFFTTRDILPGRVAAVLLPRRGQRGSRAHREGPVRGSCLHRGARGRPSWRRSARRSSTSTWPHKIWPGTRAIAQWHLDRGQQVWLVTAAPVEIANVIARRLGLTGALGTVSEHVDGIYTGELGRRDAARRGQGRRDRGDRSTARGSSSTSATRTPTPATTCRCCRWSGTRARSIRTPRCARTPRPRAGASATTAPDARSRWPAARAAAGGRCGGRDVDDRAQDAARIKH